MFAKTHFMLFSILVSLLTTVLGAAGVLPALSKARPNVAPATSQMLQFTSSGHVLGFQTSCVYVATGTYMLQESFADTKGAAPQAERPPTEYGRAQPLGKVTYSELWPGITLIYDSPPGGILRSTFQVEPGADPGQISLGYNVPVRLGGAGNLVFEFETGTMTASAPMAWQEIEGERVPVEVAFDLDDSLLSVRFSVGAYNPDFALIIDPTLTWNTFMGSSEGDYGYAIAVDGSGNVYVAGTSYASWGSPENAFAGNGDAFVAKLDSNGERQWNTFMGSSGYDFGNAIAVDSSGNVYVAGASSATWDSPIVAHAGGDDAFAAKLDSSGGRQWNTFMGSSGYDRAWAIAVDGSSNVYVAGESPSSWGSPENAHAGSDDAFAAKLNSSGERQWNTFMGSSSYDFGYAIAVDGSGNVYVTGESYATWGSPESTFAGNIDAFVAKLDNNGGRQWNTFLGSSGSDLGYAIAVDSSGYVYVAGESSATWDSPIIAHAGGYDAFVAKLNSSGGRQWNTFMGSSSNDRAWAITVNGSGNVYVAGASSTTWGSPIIAHAGGDDAFAAKLDSSGERQWNTFMGSSSDDSARAIAVNGSSNIYVAGESESTWGSPIDAFEGSPDVFAAKIVPPLGTFYIFPDKMGGAAVIYLD